MAAANVVVVPVVLATNELNALEETLEAGLWVAPVAIFR